MRHWDEVAALDSSEWFRLDVREEEEQAVGGVEGAYNIPLGELRSRLAELPRNKKILVNCATGSALILRPDCYARKALSL